MYDLLIIGSGPGGYVAAIRAAQKGLKVGCIEKSSIGGTCLNIGCIPSKSLLDSSLKHYQLINDYADHGIEANEVNIDLRKMMLRKESVVNELTNGVLTLLKSNEIDCIQGVAKILNNTTVEITQNTETVNLQTKNIIIATGSYPIELENIKLDNNIVDSEGALKFSEIPNRIVIIGAGVIGLEMGSIWSRLGSEVIILESQKEFLPMLDKRISRQIFKEFSQQGLDVRLDCEIQNLKKEGDEIELIYSFRGEQTNTETDKIILAVGRKPNIKDLFDENLLSLDENGLIKVDQFCRTSVKNIWAIGDVVRGPMLAHKASEEGIMVVERIAGEDSKINYKNVPNVIYTHPEIAWVGMNESKLKEQKINYKLGSFPFLASGRALASGESIGSVSIIADSETDKILGIQVFGPSASEIVQQGLIAMDNGITSDKFENTIFSHPTVSEALHEATLAMNLKAIHIQNKKKRS